MSKGSTLTARIVTAVIGVVVTPVAIALIYYGGEIWLMRSARLDPGLPPMDALAPRLLLGFIGLLVLAGVVLTGLWSSAGLIAVGVVALVPLSIALYPPILEGIYRLMPALFRLGIDAITTGHRLVLMLALGACGVALVLARRAQQRGDGVGPTVLGIVVVPIALAFSAWLLSAGLDGAQRRFLQTLQAELDPLSMIGVLLGSALLVGAVIATRWSRFALLVSAGFLLLVTLLSLIPGVIGLLPRPLIGSNAMVLTVGGGALAMAVVFLVHTFVVVMVRRRAALTAEVGAGFVAEQQDAAGLGVGGVVPPAE